MTARTVNRPLANTFGWLGVNGTAAALEVRSAAAVAEELPAGVTAALCREDPCAGIRTGAGPAAAALTDGLETRVYTVPAGAKPEGVLRLHVAMEPAEAGAAFCFRLGADSALTVVLDYTGAGGAARVRAELGEGAVLRLTQVQRLAEDAAFLSDLGADCAAGARLELLRLVLGGADTWDGCAVALRGAGSSLDVGAGYRVRGDGRLDMNCEAVHTGRKTRSHITADGVLSERAFKLFRGTIDLRKGCAGAVGSETENVLLLDETVRNQTVPVILCAEEDVAGDHGATIGRLDEDTAFYLESRGLPRAAVYEMMARARVDAVIRRIPDPATVAALLPAEAGAEAPDGGEGGTAE